MGFMKKWNIGIIGAGLIADFHARAIGDLPNAGLAGFCDGGSGRANKLAEQYKCRAYKGYRQMLADGAVDIVTIATPSGFHLEPAVEAAGAGKHVLCEKPIEVTSERIDAMISACGKAGVCLGGIFPCRFNEAVAPFKAAIDSGRFGKISFAGAFVPWWRHDDYYRDSWHGTWRLDGGGALMNQSIHMVDLLCYLMGEVESVQAYTGILAHEVESEDTSAAVVKFSSGALGMIYGTTASWPGQLRRIEVTGTDGTVIYAEDCFRQWQFRDELESDNQIRSKYAKAGRKAGTADPASIKHANHTKNFRLFLEALDNGMPFALDGAESRKAVEVVLAVYRSAREGRLIQL